MRPLLLLLLAGCAAPAEPVAITFRAMVGAEPYACSRRYEGLGLDRAGYTALDFRFYVHDVRLVTDGGVEIPVTFDEDGLFQSTEVALLDFETECLGGTPETHEVLTGTAPLAPSDDVVALRLRLGVPEDQNHLLAASQPPPLDQTELFWGWQSGYQFVTAIGRTDAGLHAFMLGAMDCSGDAREGTRRCNHPNQVQVELPLDGVDALQAGVVIADLAALYAGIEVAVDHGSAVGCESLTTDPECGPMFAALGLGLDGSMLPVQSFLRMEAR